MRRLKNPPLMRGGARILEILFSSNTRNPDIAALLQAQGWDGVSAVKALIVIEAGVIIGSTSYLTTSMILPAFPDGSEIRLENYGYLVGAGGRGYDGSATDTPQASAKPGGDALSVSSAIIVKNDGIIGGGGGGGGWGFSYPSVYAGGGGAGDTPGSGFPAGTLLTGADAFHDGGDLGQAGATGGGVTATNLVGKPGGKAITGISNVIFDGPQGDIRGSTT